MGFVRSHGRLLHIQPIMNCDLECSNELLCEGQHDEQLCNAFVDFEALETLYERWCKQIELQSICMEVIAGMSHAQQL